MKNCETCKHFYECDNMGYYESCLPDMKEYEVRTLEDLKDVIDDIWYDVCVQGLDIDDLLEKYSKEYHFSETEQNHIVAVLEKRQEDDEDKEE